jgi:hypothetical protein
MNRNEVVRLLNTFETLKREGTPSAYRAMNELAYNNFRYVAYFALESTESPKPAKRTIGDNYPAGFTGP